MQLHKHYTDEIYAEYMDSLVAGDDIIVMQNGHEFIKMRVTSIGEDVVRCGAANHFDLDGNGIKKPGTVMLPTKTTHGQLENCQYRRSLAAQFDREYSMAKFRKLRKTSDMIRMISIMRQK